MELIPKTVHAPEIGQTWINADPISLRSLRGQVVLLDFFDYTCVNCLRTLPYILEWRRRYQDKGLVTIGVHAPEFYFSRTAQHVITAAQDLGLDYPIVLDNDYQIWQAFANKCWPSKYLIDKDGYIRYFHMGEGGYVDFEEAIQELLRLRDPLLRFPAPMTPLTELDKPGVLQACRRSTPELYLGAARGRIQNPEGLKDNQLIEYHYGATLTPDLPELAGWWGTGDQCIEVACSRIGNSVAQPSRLRLQYSGAEVNLVLMPPPDSTGRLFLTLNGENLPAALHTEDTLSDELHRSYLRIDKPRMYRLLSQPSFTEGTLELSSDTPGLQLFAFTFNTCV